LGTPSFNIASLAHFRYLSCSICSHFWCLPSPTLYCSNAHPSFHSSLPFSGVILSVILCSTFYPKSALILPPQFNYSIPDHWFTCFAEQALQYDLIWNSPPQSPWNL